MTQRIYRSYSFIDKDPIIDQLRTLIQDANADITQLAESSGVREATICAMLFGMTRRPQFCTVQALFTALGHPLTSKGKATNIVRLPRRARA